MVESWRDEETRRDEVRQQLRVSAQAKTRDSKRKRALSGDTYAADSMLRDAKNAIDTLLSGNPLHDYDLVALEYLRGGLRDYLDGVPLTRALGVEKEGRGRIPLPELARLIQDGLIGAEVRRRLEKSGGKGKMAIYRAVAMRYGISVSKARDIVKEAK